MLPLQNAQTTTTQTIHQNIESVCFTTFCVEHCIFQHIIILKRRAPLIFQCTISQSAPVICYSIYQNQTRIKACLLVTTRNQIQKLDINKRRERRVSNLPSSTKAKKSIRLALQVFYNRECCFLISFHKHFV